MAIYGSNGSSWQPIASGDLKASDGSGWKTVKKAYSSTGFGWRQVYVGSDPQTYYFASNLTQAGRGSSWKTNASQGGSNYPQISSYSTNQAQQYKFPWYGMVYFNQDTSGVSLSTRLAERPYVKSAYFNIQRWNSGGFGSGYGNLFIGRYLGDRANSNPSYTFCNFTHSASKNWSAAGSSANTVNYSDNYLYRGEFVGGDPGSFPGGIAAGGIELGSARQSLVDHLANWPSASCGLCLTHTTNTGTGQGGLGDYDVATYAEEANYWNFWPAGAMVFGVHIGPTLVVELDYVP